MRKISMLLSVCFIFFTLVACERVSLHDGEKAIEVTNKFLKLNSAGNYKEAYEIFDTNFTKNVSFDSFAKSNSLNQDPNLGKLKKAEFKYFMLIGAQKNIELIYNCDFEKLTNIPLHFILSGSVLDGYKITVLDVGYNYKTFGDDEEKRPHLTIEGSPIITF